MAVALTVWQIAFASPALAQHDVTAEQALETYREKFRGPASLGCSNDPDSDAIIVCGRRPAVDPNRLPLPVEPEPGRRIRGEPGVMGPDCMRLCHQPVQVDLIGAIPKVIEGIKKILDPDR